MSEDIDIVCGYAHGFKIVVRDELSIGQRIGKSVADMVSSLYRRATERKIRGSPSPAIPYAYDGTCVDERSL